MTKQLRGITWNHSRGFVPMISTAQRFMETHADIEIHWEKRSLQAFADAPIGELAERYDLLVIDHPWAGYAANKGILVPLEQHLPLEFLVDQSESSVGGSHASYSFAGAQTALAIDAATPVACFRKDLLARDNVAVPETWNDLISLARSGKVAFAGIPIDTLMNFYMLCVTQGEDPCVNEDQVISTEMGVIALEQLRELSGLCTSEIFEWNPIRVYETMTSRDDIIYCPFAYGYSNYSRHGYAQHALTFTDLVAIGNHGRLRSVLGGTGLAISTHCGCLDAALEYVMYVASPTTQRTLYTETGGQPGHRSAWLDDALNQLTNDYFRATLPALDRAYMRPRYSGYLTFQDQAGDVVRDFIRFGGNPKDTLEAINRIYRKSRLEGVQS